jgi:hypothetical protein
MPKALIRSRLPIHQTLCPCAGVQVAASRAGERVRVSAAMAAWMRRQEVRRSVAGRGGRHLTAKNAGSSRRSSKVRFHGEFND